MPTTYFSTRNNPTADTRPTTTKRGVIELETIPVQYLIWVAALFFAFVNGFSVGLRT